MYWKITISPNSVRSICIDKRPDRIEIICSVIMSEIELKNILKEELCNSIYKKKLIELLVKYFGSFESFKSMTASSDYLIYQYKMRYYFPLILSGFYHIIDLEIRKAFADLTLELWDEI